MADALIQQSNSQLVEQKDKNLIPVEFPEYNYKVGFRRCIAALIDRLIMFLGVVPFIPLIWLIFKLDDTLSTEAAIIKIICFLIVIIWLVIWEIYIHVVWTRYHNGQSFGKKLTGIKIITSNGEVPTMSKLFGRWLLLITFEAILSQLAVISILFTKKRQGIHDLCVNTYVIREK
jgi:uncharacterized RDD family membrane protein YckC